MTIEIDGMYFNVYFEPGCKMTRDQPYEPDSVEIESVEVESRGGKITLPDSIRKDLEKHYRDKLIEKARRGEYE